VEPIIRTYNLSKQYGTHLAVKNLNLNVNRGDIYGFLGRNGAGKSTTIRLILSLIKPTSGYVELFNEKPGIQSFARIGSLVETPGAYPNLSIKENLEIQRQLLGINSPIAVTETLDLVNLTKDEDKKASTLSTGTLQRLGLARALLHKPEILILDEPTNGLDPAGIKEIRLLLKRLSEDRKITIFMSSHILAEIQQLATRIGIIHRGELLEEIDYEELKRKNRTYLEFKVSNPVRTTWILEEKLQIKDYSVHEENTIRIYSHLENSSTINRILVTENIDVSSIFLNEDNLEDHFLKLTSEVKNHA